MGSNAMITVILLCQLVVMCYGDTSPNLNCNVNGTKSVIHRLKRRLFCDYDKTLRPVINATTVTNATVLLEPILLDVDERTHTMNLHTSFVLKWQDEYLTWNPDHYNGVKRLHIKCGEMWIPDINIYNYGDMSKFQKSFLDDATCFVAYDGNIRAVAVVTFVTRCQTDFTYWPYDTQNCDVRMGSYGFSGQEVDFFFNTKNIIMSYYDVRNEWKIVNYTAKAEHFTLPCCPNATYPMLTLDLKIEKHISIVHAVFVIPAIVLMVFTLMILWLDSKSIERIILGVVNFACHLLCIQNLYSILPSNADKGSPHILLFYLDSFVLSMFALMVTTASRRLRSIKIIPPNWIVFAVSFIGNNRTSRFLLFDENAEFGNTKVFVNDNGSLSDEVDIEKTTSTTINNSQRLSRNSVNNTWKKLAIILEWLALISTILTYMLLLIILMPKD